MQWSLDKTGPGCDGSTCPLSIPRGVATNFCLGGGDGFIGSQTHLLPKFSFYSDFGHFILKIVENAKFS